MKSQHNFVAERALANHCPELFASEAEAEDPAVEFDLFAARLQRLLVAQLVPQLGVEGLRVTCEDIGKRKASSLYKAIGPSAANILLENDEARVDLLLSFDYGAALALTELAFGGDVQAIDAELAELPRSAWLVLETIAGQIAAGFARTAEWSGTSTVKSTHENAAKLDAFAKNERCLVWPTTLHLSDSISLPFRIVIGESAFLASLDLSNSSGEQDLDSGEAPQMQPLFGGLPLPMRAELAQFSMPVSRLARLKPGDFIPFSPRREVPLMMGTKAIARGQVGAVDDEVALNVTQLS